MKITKEDLLNSEFLKQFKDSGELDGFYRSCTNGALKKCLKVSLIPTLDTRGIHRKAKTLAIHAMVRLKRRSRQGLGSHK
jgi:hypothetical protein